MVGVGGGLWVGGPVGPEGGGGGAECLCCLLCFGVGESVFLPAFECLVADVEVLGDGGGCVWFELCLEGLADGVPWVAGGAVGFEGVFSGGEF